MREPFPLQWPDGEPRRTAGQRRRSRFGRRGQVGFSASLTKLRRQLDLLGALNAVVTSDLPVRRDGTPYAATGTVADPGIAVWFLLPDERGYLRARVLACDRWLTHAENIIAIAHTIEAMRGVERWGVAGAVSRVFAGFTALPPGEGALPPGEGAGPPGRTWREVLGGVWPAEVSAAELLAIAKTRHRAAIAQHHPDRGGDTVIAAELNTALEQAEAELMKGVVLNA